MIKVTIWNEFLHEKMEDAAIKVHPNGIHETLKEVLGTEEDFQIRTATLEMPECGLSEEVLNDTDVLIWWAHIKHQCLPDEIADRIQDHVLRGMGFIALHSAHMSKPFRKLMGTGCTLLWRDDDYERIWTVNPAHPIAQGIPASFELGSEEMYGEFFDIPEPDDLVFIGWFRGGEVFRSGCCWERGLGKVFYFQPGHETFTSFRNPYVIQILKNAVRWAAPRRWRNAVDCIHRCIPTEQGIVSDTGMNEPF